jgi:hypothetical protein
MAELDVALRQLGREIEFPPTPDIASAVRGRLERPRLSLRPVAIALAVVVVAIGAVLAVPPARTAILDWLGLRGVSIVHVDKLPATPSARPLELGRRVSLDEARARAPWLLVPDDAPDLAYMRGDRVSLLWGTPTSVRLLLSEFRGRAYIEKLLGPGTDVEPVTVRGEEGAWLEGPQVVMFRDPVGSIHDNPAWLAGNTLLWQHGDLVLRLEGDISKDEALRIARTVD